MRKLVWTLAVLALIGLAVTVTAAFNLHRLIAENRDRILDQAGVAIGRPVGAERIVMNLWGGIGIRLETIRIADDPHFSSADFIEAKAAVAQAKLLPLLRGRLEIGRITLEQPHIHLIRDGSRRWNYQTIGRHASQGNSQAGPQETAGSFPATPVPFVIGRANIAGGAISVTDGTHSPPQTTIVTQIDLTVGDVSETTPISFELHAALQAESQNVHARGTVGPLANPAAIPLRLDGAVGPLGLQALRADALHLQALLTPSSIQVSEFDGRAFDGSFALAGEVPFHPDGQITLKGHLTKIAIAKVLRLGSEDAARRLDGDGTVRLDLHAIGTSADAVRSSLSGNVQADMQHTALKDFNLVREILGRLSNLPVVGDLVSRSVKGKYARLAADADTRVRTLRGSFQIADQHLRTDDLIIEADDFGVRAAGWIAFDQEADLTGVLTMSKAFSHDVVADIKEARYLLDEHQQLALPFRLRGKLGVGKPQPDTAYLIARLTQGIGSGGLQNLLGKLLGTARPSETPVAPEEAEGAIQQGLRRLFGQ